jgi:hypothetical protein
VFPFPLVKKLEIPHIVLWRFVIVQTCGGVRALKAVLLIKASFVVGCLAYGRPAEGPSESKSF